MWKRSPPNFGPPKLFNLGLFYINPINNHSIKLIGYHVKMSKKSLFICPNRIESKQKNKIKRELKYIDEIIRK